jgi:hypothetical protein
MVSLSGAKLASCEITHACDVTVALTFLNSKSRSFSAPPRATQPVLSLSKYSLQACRMHYALTIVGLFEWVLYRNLFAVNSTNFILYHYSLLVVFTSFQNQEFAYQTQGRLCRHVCFPQGCGWCSRSRCRFRSRNSSPVKTRTVFRFFL